MAPPTERIEQVVLACCCVVALSLALHCATRFHFGFDENLHVFVASVEPGRQFLRELEWESHPPLSYVLLRWLTPRSGRELGPRLHSIAPALVSIVLAYLCARELHVARPVRLLVAWIFAVSSAHLNIALTVRGYSLATMFTLLSYLMLLRMLRDPQHTGHGRRYGFVGAALMAAWTAYSAVLALIAMSAALAFHAARNPCFRTPSLRGWKSNPGASLALIVGLAALKGWLDHTHGIGQVGHLADRFPATGESLPRFALRGLDGVLDCFAPLGLSSSADPSPAVVLAVAAALWLAVRYLRPRSRDDGPRASVVLVTILVVTIVFGIAVAGAYPFGGRMRHQFVLFPFLVFAAAIVVDLIYRSIAAAWCRTILCVGLAAWAAATSAHALRAAPIEEFSPVPTLWPHELAPALRALGDTDVVYAGRIGVVAIFSHFRDRRWEATERGPGGDLFHVTADGRPTLRVLRSDDYWLPSPIDDPTAARLAAGMRQHGFTGARVVSLLLESEPVRARERQTPSVRETLRRNGILLEKRLVYAIGETLEVSLLAPLSRPWPGTAPRSSSARSSSASPSRPRSRS